MKSIVLSVITVIAALGLTVATIFLFGVNLVLGIVGIVVTVAVVSALGTKANTTAGGLINKLIARVVMPLLIVFGIGGILLYFFLP